LQEFNLGLLMDIDNTTDRPTLKIDLPAAAVIANATGGSGEISVNPKCADPFDECFFVNHTCANAKGCFKLKGKLKGKLTLFNDRLLHNQSVFVGVFVYPVAVDITKMISDGGGGGWGISGTVGSRHFIRYKYHHSVLPSCEGIPLSTA